MYLIAHSNKKNQFLVLPVQYLELLFNKYTFILYIYFIEVAICVTNIKTFYRTHCERRVTSMHKGRLKFINEPKPLFFFLHENNHLIKTHKRRQSQVINGIKQQQKLPVLIRHCSRCLMVDSSIV